jgi:hypothetical protein
MQNWTPEPEAKAAKAPEDAFVAWLRAEPTVQAEPEFRGIADRIGGWAAILALGLGCWIGLIYMARSIVA